jgi:hypothetical protein
MEFRAVFVDKVSLNTGPGRIQLSRSPALDL